TRQGVIFVDIPANIMKLGKAIGEGYLSHNTAILGDTSIIKLQIVTEVKKKFDFTKLLRGQSCHEVGKHVIGALLVSKEIDTEVFREFFGDENPINDNDNNKVNVGGTSAPGANYYYTNS
ncbi:237_t:CDS:2, partial [Entrophospora sp. SA101]